MSPRATKNNHSFYMSLTLFKRPKLTHLILLAKSYNSPHYPGSTEIYFIEPFYGAKQEPRESISMPNLTRLSTDAYK